MLNDKVSEEEVIPEELIKLAAAILGNQEKAVRWLNKPNRSLSGDTPISRLNTEEGSERIKKILYRIEHGLFS